MEWSAFRFKKFSVEQAGAAHPVGTDAVLLGAWANIQATQRFLDIGTGTGVVALMLAQRLSDIPNWAGVGVEIHPESAALARVNFKASPWAKHLDIWEGAVQAFSGQVFDLIVSNPPFFSERTISPDKTRSLGRHTATLSPEDLLDVVSHLLAPQGRFCVILPTMEGRQLCELAVPKGLYWTQITEVRSRPGKPVERLLIQFEKSPIGFERSVLYLYAGKSGMAYSDEFQAITSDFYL
jgi:tRNA1Val (adenine37-N6)-methyltransferase